MNIELQAGTLKKFLKGCPIKYQELEESLLYYDEYREVELDLASLKEKELDALEQFLESEKEGDDRFLKGARRKVLSYRKVKQDPGGKKISRLEDLEVALKEYLKDVPKHWLFTEEDGYYQPYLVVDIKYHPRERRSESPAVTKVKLIALRRGHEEGEMLYWHREDLGKSVPELLQEEGYFVPTKAMMWEYEESMKRYKELQPLTGAQFNATGEGVYSKDRWSHSRLALVREGVPVALVMDDENEEGFDFGEAETVRTDTLWGKQDEEGEFNRVAVPVHPYLKLFDLDNHNFLRAHVDQLEHYTWKPSLGDKLILPKQHKTVVQILMSTASQDIDDIIRGKSGGTIVICTGEPGTGKTLTAEVTSEVIQRSLYKVNCSQLGTDEAAIEEELTKVLQRATRWKALLLIDEADVYIRARDNDIQQNAIVGVFLRVLEYYRGVLFLTSNRATVIDDAIMSRATVHLKYEKPTVENLRMIWRILSDQFGLKLTDPFIEELVSTFPGIVGRDVKAMLKLVIRYCQFTKEPISLKVFKLLAVHKDIKEK